MNEFKYIDTAESANAQDLEELKRMRQSGIEWHIETQGNNAQTGNLECMKYAFENGCPWSEKTTMCASRYGHLDCLRYAHENGCLYYYCDHSQAANNNHFDCLRYLYEEGEFTKYYNDGYWIWAMIANLYEKKYWTCFFLIAYQYHPDAWIDKIQNISLSNWNEELDFNDWRIRIYLEKIYKFVYETPLGEYIREKREELELIKEYTKIECDNIPKEVINFIINEYY